jgi:rod shape-determining protein MreD
MRARQIVLAVLVLLLAVVVQTTLFSRFEFVTPDLVLLLSILFAATSMRNEAVLVMSFAGGLVVDLLGSTVLGLRAAVFTLAGYLAIRTVDRADLGPVAVAIWAGLITLVGVVLFLLIGTLFGQGGLIGTGLGRRIVLVPLANMVFTFPIAPALTRLLAVNPRGVM